MRLLGLEVHRSDRREQLARRLAPLLKQLDVTHVIDVGANSGQFGSMIRRDARFTGRLDSYEPAASAYSALRTTAAGDSCWHVHHRALSDRAGTAQLHVHDDTSLNSLSATTEVGNALFRGWGSEERETETVTVGRLDEEILPDVGPVLLKLDTQGHDFVALAGAGAVLDRTVLLLMELAFVPLYETSVVAADALARLDQFGFGLVDLWPITRDGYKQLLLVEADGLFARRQAPAG